MIAKEYRSPERLKEDFRAKKTIREKIQIATEWYVMSQNEKKSKEYLRRHIPSKTKYLSMIVKYRRDFWLLHAVNPAMNGMWWFIELSKSETNIHLPDTYRPKSLVITDAVSFDDVLNQMQTRWISFPVMIKPDHCEQSYGVMYIRTASDLNEYLTSSPFHKFIIETYITAKKEFWIFIERPGWAKQWKFRVTSCVEKQKPTVVWDWVSSVEMLIHWLWMSWDITDRILWALSKEERLTILDEWTYMVVARTATSYFWVTQKECTDQITPAIEEKLREVVAWYEGFYFWRFDIMTESLEDIAQWKFRIIELNWSSGIPLHIYSPWKSIIQRHQIMTDHFDCMFQIAKQNVEAFWYTKYSFFHMLRYFVWTISKQRLPGSPIKFRKSTWVIFLIYIRLQIEQLIWVSLDR